MKTLIEKRVGTKEKPPKKTTLKAGELTADFIAGNLRPSATKATRFYVPSPTSCVTRIGEPTIRKSPTTVWTRARMHSQLHIMGAVLPPTHPNPSITRRASQEIPREISSSRWSLSRRPHLLPRAVASRSFTPSMASLDSRPLSSTWMARGNTRHFRTSFHQRNHSKIFALFNTTSLPPSPPLPDEWRHI